MLSASTLAVGLALLRVLDPATSTAPLAAAVDAVGAAWAVPVVRVGAALASLGALLALIAGIGRTSLAMARNHDLPAWLAAVHPRFQVPHHAEIALAVVVGVLVLTTDLRGVIGFSSFGVLLYYAIANASAFTQPADQRRWPRAINVIGLIGCVVLAVTLPWTSALVAAALLALALIVRAAQDRSRRIRQKLNPVRAERQQAGTARTPATADAQNRSAVKYLMCWR